MKDRVECDQCENFVDSELEDMGDMFSKILVKAKCKLGKRIMFRKPKNQMDGDYGYIRICKDFK